jgi:dihydroorotase
MPGTADLIVRNGTVVTADSTVRADLATASGRFVAIEAPGSIGLTATEEFDATGLYVLPGVIDGHVHFREPGLGHKEDWTTGSTAAVHGGVTTVIDMPNTRPPTATADQVDEKRALAEHKSFVDFGIIGLLAQDGVRDLEPMAQAGVVGFKAFLGETIGEIPAPDDGTLLDGLREAARLGYRVGFHAENNSIIQHFARRIQAEARRDPLAHLDSRPAIAEVEAIQRVALLAREAAARIHIFHLSSRDGLEAVTDWRRRDVDITAELTPHHAFLSADDAPRLGVRLRVNPPVRHAGHGDALLAALADGWIDMIASDHAPHTREEKLTDDVWSSVSGFPGVETSLRLFLTCAVNAGRMTLQQLVRATSLAPAQTWGLWPQKGTIRIGSDADLTIVDVDRTGVIRDAELHSKSPVTPYDGMSTRGAAVATIVRGTIVVRDGSIVSEPSGRMVRPSIAAGGG